MRIVLNDVSGQYIVPDNKVLVVEHLADHLVGAGVVGVGQHVQGVADVGTLLQSAVAT